MTATVKLPARLDTGAAPTLKDQLIGLLEGDAVFDGSAVSHIGGRCLQLLVVGCADAAGRGKTWRFEGFPDATIEQLSLLGFTPETLASGVAS